MSLTGVQALYDGGGIDEEATAKGTADIWIELVEGEFGLWEHKQITVYSDAVVWYVSITLVNMLWRSGIKFEDIESVMNPNELKEYLEQAI